MSPMGKGNDTTGHNWRKDRRQMIEAWPGRNVIEQHAQVCDSMHGLDGTGTYLEYLEMK